MNKVKVTIKVNGKTYTAVTNKNGKATFKITKLTKKGTFKSVITYKGNSLYKKVTKTVKIKISQIQYIYLKQFYSNVSNHFLI